MAQFDVHRNTGKQKEAIPYVVIVQSSLYDGYRRRVVVPLVRAATDQLSREVGTLAKDGDRVIAVIDELLTRAWA